MEAPEARTGPLPSARETPNGTATIENVNRPPHDGVLLIEWWGRTRRL